MHNNNNFDIFSRIRLHTLAYVTYAGEVILVWDLSSSTDALDNTNITLFSPKIGTHALT